ncbi:spermatogenesis-associated protein 24 [Alligator mississippiensis]|uniref:spermatogenesis-associated protein 24 n=1 Tax=Alligator mississippiensis TaxID=8496 RepID=UPI0009073C7A|nr:spermatogenesis-associated protein 24 [Alligator mississippiensis]
MAAGPGALAFRQLRDVAAAQEALIERLLRRERGGAGRAEQHEVLARRLAKEEEEHGKTKMLLVKESEKLQFALGEIEVLSKQLERERRVFEKTLASVKSKALKESTKKDKLISKCNEIEHHILKQEDILNGKENEIKALQHFITRQKQVLKSQVWDLNIQKQQECYIVRVLDKKQKKGLK